MNIQRRINELEEDCERLKRCYDAYKQASSELDYLKKTLKMQEFEQQFTNLMDDTEYFEPTYPDMGTLASNGKAKFSTKVQAELLISHLVSRGSYYYGYHLQWEGAGEYAVVPSFKRDHDGETIYTATFKKENSETQS